MAARTPPVELSIDYSGSRKNMAILVPLVGKSGWLTAARLQVSSLDTEEAILLAGWTDDGCSLDQNQCRRFFDLTASVGRSLAVPTDARKRLDEAIHVCQGQLLEEVVARNGRWFDVEIERLDHWADDLKDGIERELRELEVEIRALKKQASQASTLEKKLEGQRQVKEMERRLKEKRKQRDEAQDEVEARKDRLIEEIESRLRQTVQSDELFCLRWHLA
jgi:hypothetical protein